MFQNDMIVDQIDLRDWLDRCRCPEVLNITQEEYDLIQLPDPCTIYVITNSKDNRMYYGDVLVTNKPVSRKYLLGPADKYGEYIIYLNELDIFNERVIEISRFNSPDKAMRALTHYNKVGSHLNHNLRLYGLITSYIDKNITCHDLIIGIISVLGFRDDTRLQDVISEAIRHGANSKQKDLPITFREYLKTWSDNTNCNQLFKYYSDLYDLIVKYNYFSDSKYHEHHPELADVINDINEVVRRI